MKAGKLSEAIYDRSVYKTIQSINKSSDLGKEYTTACGTSVIGSATGKDAYVVFRACIAALNILASNGAKVTGSEVGIDIFFPADLREAKLRAMIDYATEKLASLDVTIGNVKVTVLPEIKEAIVSATALTNDTISFANKCRENQDIVMTKWMALEGSALIAMGKHRELNTRYPMHLIEDTYKFIEDISIINEAAGAMKSNVSAMQTVREGGVFGALWELAKRSDVGLVIDLKKIPVKQETIEVCEFYDINPYMLLSGGSLLLTTDNGLTLVSQLEELGIKATVIGKTTKGHDRIINNDDDTRFLEPAKEDEYYKVMYSQGENEEE